MAKHTAAVVVAFLCLTATWAAAQSRPLPPSLECSACEVTAREIYYGYVNRSKHDKFAGTELEFIEVMEKACRRLGKYILAQEAFGSHLKVYADPTVRYDIQNIEKVQFYSKKEYTNLQGAITQLVLRCQHYTGEFEDELGELITKRAPEADVRKFMCLERTDICSDDRLAPYKAKQSIRRKKWKRKYGRDDLLRKWDAELNDGGALVVPSEPQSDIPAPPKELPSPTDAKEENDVSRLGLNDVRPPRLE
eukprot:CAMPEP_0174831166 /NCGR_PEP_ID=MMETSP1114-20130205/2946_1 /TAXON_ID=312471 /ORGANISM="Neobodo designis, Strain CCAP 1951/1" /LENGTH=249 /DNA_ID=CAMNT_0016064987 /DNA_START=32 /DNA_END=779 /DNA_ORIENTATION=+